MPNISRATLPSEYFDITSAQLLMQPEPEYPHAFLIKSALAAELDIMSGIALPLAGRSVDTSGPKYSNSEGEQLKLTDPFYSNAIKVVAELGDKGVGHTVRINRPKFTNSTYTLASRRVPVGTTISTTPINLEAEQVSITIERFCGPYDNTGTEVRPYGIERFDASRSIHAMDSIRDMHFKRDFDRWLDTVGVQLFDSASTVVYPTGMTAVNDATVANAYPFSFNQILETAESLKNGYIPKFASGKYMMIITPTQTRQLMQDPDYQRLVRAMPAPDLRDYHPILRSSFKASIGDFDIFESTTLTQTANSSSVAVQYGQAFGPGMIGAGADNMPVVVPNTNDNYGETVFAIWKWYAGFGVLDNRFGRSVRSA